MQSFDLVVAGSGGAGLLAALSAAVRGSKVAVLESQPLLGGTTAISGAYCWLPGNPFAKRMGFNDSRDQVLTYLQHLTLGTVARERLIAFVDEVPNLIDFMQQHLDLEMVCTTTPDYRSDLPGSGRGRTVHVGLFDTNRLGDLKAAIRWPRPTGGYPPVTHEEVGHLNGGNLEMATGVQAAIEERLATGVAGGGCALVAALVDACVRHGVRFFTERRVVKLVERQGRITGVEALHLGEMERFDAERGVVLANGGFEWNSDLWTDLVGVPFDGGPLTPPVSFGDNINLAMQAGARIGNMNGGVWMVPTFSIPGETYEGQPFMRAFLRRHLPGSIIVNRSGRRFTNEALNYNDFAKELVKLDIKNYAFSNLPAYMIFDHEYLLKYPLLGPDVSTAIDDSWLTEADSLEELAEKIGIDGAGLSAQVAEFNRDARLGVDPVFQRGENPWEIAMGDSDAPHPVLGPLVSPPYYALRIRLGSFGTKAGAVTDAHAKALDFANRPIPGLYAVGNAAAALTGQAYAGGGSTLGPAMTFGFIAGRDAAA